MKGFFIWVSIPLKITITLLRDNVSKELSVHKEDTIGAIIKELGLFEDSIIVLNKNSPVPIDESVSNYRNLTVVEVSSGG